MIDIVIVNWNAGALLEKCVSSILLSNNEYYVSQVFVVDNHSTDHSLQDLLKYAKVKVIQNDSNLGFAKACNQGFKAATAQYILLLNPDTELFENTLKDCIDFMQQQQEVDILGAQLLNEDRSIAASCARFPTPAAIFRDALGLPKIAPSLFKPAILMTDWDHRQSRYVDQVMGAFMFMRRDIFKKLGYFDEQFFVYFEELDFSLRLAKAGGKSYYNTGIQAIHSGKGTTESVKAFRLFLNLRSRLLFAKKHFSTPGYWLVLTTTFSIEFISRNILLLVRGKAKECIDVWKAYKMLLTRNTAG